MARYPQTCEELRKAVELFTSEHLASADVSAFVSLGHIINLAVRCNPRQPQGVVRKTIVSTAMQKYCRVHMTKEYDTDKERSYNKIHIYPREIADAVDN